MNILQNIRGLFAPSLTINAMIKFIYPQGGGLNIAITLDKKQKEELARFLKSGSGTLTISTDSPQKEAKQEPEKAPTAGFHSGTIDFLKALRNAYGKEWIDYTSFKFKAWLEDNYAGGISAVSKVFLDAKDRGLMEVEHFDPDGKKRRIKKLKCLFDVSAETGEIVLVKQSAA